MFHLFHFQAVSTNFLLSRFMFFMQQIPTPYTMVNLCCEL